MHLRHVSIRNFRGMRDLRLDLGRTTAITGENDMGKTSIVDALHLCLGDHREQGQPTIPLVDSDIHRPQDGSPREPAELELVFSEYRQGDWDTPELADLAETMVPGRRAREVRLRVRAEPRDGAAPAVRWHLSRRGAGPDAAPEHERDPLLAELRRLNPIFAVYWNRFYGTTHGERDGSAPAGPTTEPASDRQRLSDEIESVYHQLVRSRTALPAAELDRGIEALRELFEQEPDLLEQRPRRRRKRDMVVAPLRNWPVADRELGGDTSHVDRLALLALAGMLIESRGDGPIPPGADLLVIIEEPEVHLHPATLASLLRWIDQLNAQKILTTHSPDVLGAVPLRAVRRLAYEDGQLGAYRIRSSALSLEDQRRIGFHLRVRRGTAFFARCWLLMEGETEFWLVPEVARLCGYDLASEAVACVDFAQCGLAPLIKLANALGISWHVLTDGDSAGQFYHREARAHLNGSDAERHITVLPERNIERFLWKAGFDDVYRKHASANDKPSGRLSPSHIINRAIKARSKPSLVLDVMEAMQDRRDDIPELLARMIGTAVDMSRQAGPTPPSPRPIPPSPPGVDT